MILVYKMTPPMLDRGFAGLVESFRPMHYIQPTAVFIRMLIPIVLGHDAEHASG